MIRVCRIAAVILRRQSDGRAAIYVSRWRPLYLMKAKILESLLQERREFLMRKIMVIDDDRGFLDRTKNMLSLSGYSVNAVSDAGIAVKEAIKSKPDLIMLDLSMPEKSGFEVAQEMKLFSELEGVPIIGMDEFPKGRSWASFGDLYGIRSFIRKSFKPLDLIYRIEKLLP